MAATTSFMIISDTHGLENDVDCPLNRAKSTKVDVVLHCGDLTQIGGMGEYRKALRMLGDINAELKLVIAGNHDLSLDGEYWAANLDEEAGDEPEEHDEAVEIMTGKLAAKAGVIYLTEGTHTFTLKNGAAFSIYVSPYQPAFGDWAFGYPPGQDRFGKDAANPLPDDVDIVMTHGPPHGILDQVPSRSTPGQIDNLGCKTLLRAVERSRPLMHCFGHLHEGYGMEVKKWESSGDAAPRADPAVSVTQAGVENPVSERHDLGGGTLMVNAAIMDDHHTPANAPWVVDLVLPRR